MKLQNIAGKPFYSIYNGQFYFARNKTAQWRTSISGGRSSADEIGWLKREHEPDEV